MDLYRQSINNRIYLDLLFRRCLGSILWFYFVFVLGVVITILLLTGGE